MTSVILNLDKLLAANNSLLQVRRQLLLAERDLGLSELHTHATKMLKKGGARLVHGQGHLTEVVAFAISPNGRHLATGGWVGDDYERGGALQIWDIEMGRCVNVLDPIDGGIGWPEYPNCLTWSNDGEKLGIAFCTNSVGIFDPFGESPLPLAQADVTDGWSRPPAFCLLPDGKHAFVSCWRGADVPGALVIFKDKPSKKSPKRLAVLAVKAMAEKIPKAMKKQLEKASLEPAKRVIASPDGSRAFCINSHNFAYSISLEKGELEYLTKIGLPAAYSPDGRYLAHTLVGLVIYDGHTGLPTMNLPMHMGMNALHWGKRGENWRLAGVVSAENEFNADPGVHIYDDHKYRYSIDVKPRKPRWDDGDFAAFAWAPNGERAAVLDDEGRLHIVNLGEKVTSERVLPMKEGLRGVFWASPEGSSRDIVILASRECLIFIDADTGAIIAEHIFMRAPETQRPLDTGSADLADLLRPDPSFAIDGESWGAAFPEGLVIAPEDKKDAIDSHLAWSINRRYAWPARWGEIEMVSTAADVATATIQPKGVNWKKFKKAKSPKAPKTFPPPNPPTLGKLYAAVVESVSDLDRGWWSHVSENLWRACLIRARQGEISEALEMTQKIPGIPESLCAQAELTAIAYRKGHGRLLDESFDFVVGEVETEMQPHNEIVYSIAMFSAWDAKKDKTQSAAWLARAKAKLEPENNPWEYRLALIWALVDAGRIDDARTFFAEKAPWVREPLIFHSYPFVMAMVRDGHVALLFEFLEAWKKYRFGNIDWSLRDKLGQILAHHGQLERLVEGKEHYGIIADDERIAMARSREKTGLVLLSPSAADIEMLAHDYAELQKTPRARRAGGTRALIQKAASMGHSGAIVALLPDLPANNFNDQPQAAFSALWTITTGFDIIPW